MDKIEIEIEDDSKKGSSTEVEKTVRINRKEFEDGGYEEVRVEDVEGGLLGFHHEPRFRAQERLELHPHLSQVSSNSLKSITFFDS